jgi:cytochrome c oxidase subunit 3
MALATAVSGHAGGHAAHDRAKMLRVGLWLFFFSESILFGLLLSARFYLEGISREHVDQFLGFIITVILLLSSMTAYTAETAIEHDRRTLANWGLFLTILLGVIFAGGVAVEWSTAEFSRHQSFGTVFFTMTGVHASHVLSGILMLVLALSQSMRGRYTGKSHWPLSAIVMYWHFVDLVWVFFYPALYLVS